MRIGTLSIERDNSGTIMAAVRNELGDVTAGYGQSTEEALRRLFSELTGGAASFTRMGERLIAWEAWQAGRKAGGGTDEIYPVEAFERWWREAP